MTEPDDALHDRLLREWHIQHELAHFYATALLRLMPGDPDAVTRRRELSAKLTAVMLALTQVTDQLQAYEREHELALSYGTTNLPN